MSVCEPHDQVISPCADDAAASLLGLGTRGDIAYSEYGNMPLSAGQTDVAIEFLYEKTNWGYVFVHCYVGNYDGVPTDAIQCVTGSQTSKGFAVKFSGAPTTNDSVLFWEVRIPDNLQACQSVTSSPKYAIVPPYQQGIEELNIGQEFLVVTFPEEHPIENWYPTLVIEKLGGGNPQIFAWIMTARSKAGFRLDFQGSPDTDGYFLRWRIS